MNTPPPPPPVPPALSKQGFDTPLMVVGILFIVGWLGVHVVWAMLSGMANLMANDSGRASSNAQMALIVEMLVGVIVAGAAGVPAGLAIFWRGKRVLLLGAFVVLFLLGAGCQAWAFHSFFSSIPS